jgi:hypothetical protein
MQHHKPEVQSIEQEQAQGQKVISLMKEKPLKRFFKYLYLNKPDKIAYKKLRQKQRSNLDNKKKDFNKKNIFEVEHYDF